MSGHTSDDFVVAPAALVRVPAIELARFEPLRDPALGQAAAAVSDHDRGATEAFERAYDEAIQRERAALWAATARDAHFRCAVALASPSLHERLGDGAMPARRTKRVRHLETSLLRYLSRAVSRIEPSGLWSGVTIAEFIDEPNTTVAPAPARTAVAPELAPMRAMVQALAARSPYRERGPYRLNPTLQRRASGWTFAQAPIAGRSVWITLPDHPLWAVLQRLLAGRAPASSAQWVQSLSAEMAVGTATAVVSMAIDRGLALGGLNWPGRYRDPWEALRKMAVRLEAEHRRSWIGATARMRRVCARLQRHLDGVLAGDRSDDGARARAASQPVCAAAEQVRATLEGLADELGVPPPEIAAAPLRCDLRMPLRVGLGRDDRAQLIAALADWFALERRYDSLVAHEVRADRHQAQAGAGAGGVTAAPREDAPRGAATLTSERGGPPLLAFVVRPAAAGIARGWIRGCSVNPTATHARHAYHLGGRQCDPIERWFRATLAELGRSSGLQMVDLLVPAAGSPNVIARPRYVEPVLDPWAIEPDGPDVAGLALDRGPRPSAVVIRGAGHPIVAHGFSPTPVPDDVVVRRLLATSFRDESPVARIDPRPGAPTSSASGATLTPPRVELGASEVHALAGSRGAARFLIWSRWVRRHALPTWVRLLISDRPALLIPIDSALALEAAFEGVTPSSGGVPTTIAVEAMVEGPWWPGVGAAPHLAEIVVPVRRCVHAWTPCERACHIAARTDVLEAGHVVG